MTKPNPKASARASSGRGTKPKKQPAKSSSQQNSRGLTTKNSAPVSRSFTQRNLNSSSTSAPHTRTEVVAVIGSPNANGAFAILNKFPINPGLSLTFPWLSAIAANYEVYKIRRFTVDFVPACPSSTPGLVIIVPAPDAYESAPYDVTSAYSFEGAAIGNAWDRLTCNIDVRKYNLTNSSARFIRTGQVPGDRKTYDFGLFWVCCEGVPNSTQLGTIRVTYTVDLMEPILASLQSYLSLPNLLITSDGGSVEELVPSGTKAFDTAGAGALAGMAVFEVSMLNGADFFSKVQVTCSSGNFRMPVLPQGFYRCTVHYLLTETFSSVGTDNTNIYLQWGLTTNLLTYSASLITNVGTVAAVMFNDAIVGTDSVSIDTMFYFTVPQNNTGLMLGLFHSGSSFTGLLTDPGITGQYFGGCYCTIEFLSSEQGVVGGTLS